MRVAAERDDSRLLGLHNNRAVAALPLPALANKHVSVGPDLRTGSDQVRAASEGRKVNAIKREFPGIFPVHKKGP